MTSLSAFSYDFELEPSHSVGFMIQRIRGDADYSCDDCTITGRAWRKLKQNLFEKAEQKAKMNCQTFGEGVSDEFTYVGFVKKIEDRDFIEIDTRIPQKEALDAQTFLPSEIIYRAVVYVECVIEVSMRGHR